MSILCAHDPNHNVVLFFGSGKGFGKGFGKEYSRCTYGGSLLCLQLQPSECCKVFVCFIAACIFCFVGAAAVAEEFFINDGLLMG